MIYSLVIAIVFNECYGFCYVRLDLSSRGSLFMDVLLGSSVILCLCLYFCLWLLFCFNFDLDFI